LVPNASFKLRLKPGAVPVAIDNRRFSRQQELFLKELVAGLEERNVVTKIDASPWNTPVNLVPKNDSWRLTMDMSCSVNPRTENDDYPLPLIQPILQDTARFRYFSKIDLSNGYWHIETRSEETRKMLAFTVPGLGKYCWNRLVQGLKQSPSIFQREMDRILFPYRDWCRPYLDDCPIGANTLDELRVRQNQVLRTLQEHGLVVNKDKSIFEVETLPLLGFVVSHDSILPDNNYLQSLKDWRVPDTKTQLRKFLGKFSHVAKHFPSLQDARAVLFSALNSRKDVTSVSLTGRTRKAFDLIQDTLVSPRALNSYDPTDPAPIKIVGDAGSSGYASLAFQGERLIGSIARKYPLPSLVASAPLVREFYCFKSSLLAFQDVVNFAPRFSYLTDSQPLYHMRLLKEQKPSTYAFPNHFFQRMFDSVSHLWSRCDINWTPRSDPIIKAVDLMGRFDPG
jgi:hypothetical protein